MTTGRAASLRGIYEGQIGMSRGKAGKRAGWEAV